MAADNDPQVIAHELVQKHMAVAGITGFWELLEERIAAAIRLERLEAEGRVSSSIIRERGRHRSSLDRIIREAEGR